jgi:hypothetical protein
MFSFLKKFAFGSAAMPRRVAAFDSGSDVLINSRTVTS